MTRAAIILGLALALVSTAGVSQAQVPEQMNYQVMLTDGANQPLVDQVVQLVFRIYDQESGGSQLWAEAQSVTTNSIGVVSVMLGSINPLTVDFGAPRWLQVEVDGEVMAPRRELVAAPYARQAHNSNNLGGEPAASFALSSTLSTAGTINSPGNPVDWTKLKSVPAGFADGTDDAGLGDGSSLDASDGSPVDALYVDALGNVVVDSATVFPARLHVRGAPGTTAVRVAADSNYTFGVGVFAVADSASAIVGNAYGDFAVMTVPMNPAGVSGIGWAAADGGFFQANGTGDGVECWSLYSGAALKAEADGTGYSGHFTGGAGVLMERENSYPVLTVENASTTGWGDAGWFRSPSGMNSSTWTIYGLGYEGNVCRIEKMTDDDQYAATVYGASGGSEGLYVQGTVVSTALAARAVPTSRGTEAVFGVTAPEVEVMASGSNRLSSGTARVEFDRLFAESIAGAADLRVTATAVGAWSALYIERIDGGGFVLRSDAGAKDVEFHWVAVGRAKGYERAPEIAFPDPEEDARIAAEKRAAVDQRRPVEHGGPSTVTMTTGGIGRSRARPPYVFLSFFLAAGKRTLLRMRR